MGWVNSAEAIGYGQKRRGCLKIAERVVVQGFRAPRIADLERRRIEDPAVAGAEVQDGFFLSGFIGRNFVSYSRLSIDEALWLAQELQHEGARALVITECDPKDEAGYGFAA